MSITTYSVGFTDLNPAFVADLYSAKQCACYGMFDTNYINYLNVLNVLCYREKSSFNLSGRVLNLCIDVSWMLTCGLFLFQDDLPKAGQAPRPAGGAPPAAART